MNPCGIKQKARPRWPFHVNDPILNVRNFRFRVMTGILFRIMGPNHILEMPSFYVCQVTTQFDLTRPR